MTKSVWRPLMCTVIGILLIGTAHAGLVVYGTRFVLAAPRTGLSVTVNNTNTSGILVKSQMDRGEGKGMMPFVVTPPLFVLKGGKSNQLRLVCPECNQLPADRESCFRLSISAIPSGKAPPNSVQLAIRSHFKVFYRPEGLKGDARTAYQQLRWRREGARLVISNPTPYYVTLFKTNVNNRLVTEPGMIAPFSESQHSWCPATGHCVIQWRSLDDFGADTPSWVITPDAGTQTGKAG